jgi:hypothetical protein
MSTAHVPSHSGLGGSLGFEFPTNPYPAFYVPKKCQRLPHQSGFGLWVRVLGYGAGLWFWVWVMVLGYGFLWFWVMVLGLGHGAGLWFWVWVIVLGLGYGFGSGLWFWVGLDKAPHPLGPRKDAALADYSRTCTP